jgi:hypothetical protein
MMEKETSTRRSLLRALYLLPLVCISLALNAQTKVNYVYNDGKQDSSQSTNDDKTVTTSMVVNEFKLDGEEMEGMSLDSILDLLPYLKKDANGKITIDHGSQVNGGQVQKIIVNGKVLYGQEATANAEPAIPRISVVDSGSGMIIDLSGNSSETVDKIIKALPGAEFDEDGNITVNGKPVKKILVNGKEYNSGDPYNIYVSRIVEEVEGEVPNGHNRVTTVTVNENGQVTITNKDEKAPANTSDK